MTIQTTAGQLTFGLDMTFTLAFASILLLLGYGLKNRSAWLQKYCIPAPVIGGFIFMLLTTLGYFTHSFKFEFNTDLQTLLMNIFFTTVGLEASLKILKQGGKLLIIYWLIAGLVSVLENTIGILGAKLTGLPPAYALLSSAISMIGGHGAALSYGQTFQHMGYAQGPLVGAAAATFGLIFSVLVGGPTASRLIRKHQLKPQDHQEEKNTLKDINAAKHDNLSPVDVLKNVTVILVTVALGTLLSKGFGALIQMEFPTYVGCMFVAVLVRNINERIHGYPFSFALVDGIGNVTLSLYLSMAMMTLKLWELADLAGGMLVILVMQVIFLVLFSYFIVFRLLGSDYDAAVMCAGLLGHGLGATPTALVNLTAVNDKYGLSVKAMMIVPIVGAFLVDILYQPQTIWFIKQFVH